MASIKIDVEGRSTNRPYPFGSALWANRKSPHHISQAG